MIGATGYSILSFAFASAVVCHCMLPGTSAPPRFNGLMWSTTNPGHAPEVLPVAGQGLLAWNALLASGLRAIRPLAVRAQEVHFVVDGIRVCGEVERRSERTADRG